MNRVQTETQSIREILFKILGETIAKTYFSYYGIFQDGSMFGLYKDGKFYLKLATQDIHEITTYADIQQLQDPNIVQSQRYYYLPNHILDHIEDHAYWFENSIKNIKFYKNISYYNRKQQIRFLPNMSFTFERMLRKIGIYTIDDLVNKGEIATFVELIKIGIDATQITLFKLYGAINHQLIYTIPTSKKIALLEEADEALYAAGLRRRFKLK